jgi:hypothetical protein
MAIPHGGINDPDAGKDKPGGISTWGSQAGANGQNAYGNDAAYMQFGYHANANFTLTDYNVFKQEFMNTPEMLGMFDRYGQDFYNFSITQAALGVDGATFWANVKERGWTPAGVDFSKFGPKRSNGPGGGGGGGASKAQQYAAAEAAIRNQVQTLGHTTYSEDQIKATARLAVNNKWSAEQLTDVLVKDATANWDKLTGGTLKGAVDQIKAAAAKQLIKISDTTARQWAGRLASSELDSAGITNMMQEQAMARYSWAADIIKKGVTMQDFLAPSRDRIAEVLEVPPEKVDLMDPKWSKMVTVTDAKGVTRAANDDELIRAARTDGGWVNTKNARQMATSAAMALRNMVEGRA